MPRGSSSGVSTAGAAILVLVLVLGALSITYVSSTQGTSDLVRSQNVQISSLESQFKSLQSQVTSGHGTPSNVTLPVMDQSPAIRRITETWFLSPEAHQDRFEPSFIVVNQGDNVSMTLIDNDTVAHDFVIGRPYDIVINATVPGLINDETGQTFTTAATHNSPGVVVKGTPGNVSATYSFIASATGIFEFVCTYHADVGMIGYLVVLPNLGYKGSATTTTTTTSTGQATGGSVSVSIVPGAYNPAKAPGFSPDSITVVLGVNNTVVWTNNDSQTHTVTSDTQAFDSGPIYADSSYSITFSSAGIYHYHCTYHPWMTGTVTVLSAP